MPDQTVPPQDQDRQPGIERKMTPPAGSRAVGYKSTHRLVGKVALITGGDSGIGRAVAVAFAKEGLTSRSCISARKGTMRKTPDYGPRRGVRFQSIPGGVTDPGFCRKAVETVIGRLGRLDILVNNAA